MARKKPGKKAAEREPPKVTARAVYAPPVEVKPPPPPPPPPAPPRMANGEVSDWALKLDETWVPPPRIPDEPVIEKPREQAPVPVVTAPVQVSITVEKPAAVEPAPAAKDTRSAAERLAALTAMTTSKQHPEQRSNNRYAFNVQVEYSAVGNTSSDPAQNLSSTGMFIHTANPLEVGDAVTVSFLMPGTSTPVILPARVKWVNAFDRGDRASGMGIEFSAMDDKKRRALAAVLARLKDGGPT